jgi:hypothetical protein
MKTQKSVSECQTKASWKNSILNGLVYYNTEINILLDKNIRYAIILVRN